MGTKPAMSVPKKAGEQHETPNLVVTYDPSHGTMAKQEIEYLFRKIKMPVSFTESQVTGLFRLKTMDAREAVKKLTGLSESEPGLFLTTRHFVPVDAWTASNVKDMQKAISGLEHEISNSDKWKLDLHKRQWDEMNENELVHELTDVVDRPKVDLKNPDKIIHVEIIGNQAGISLLKKKERLYMRAP